MKLTSIAPSEVATTAPSPWSSKPSSRTSSPMRTTVRSSRATGKLGGHDRGPAGRQRLQQLALRAPDALDRADLLQVDGADRGDHADLGPRERAELRDLAEAAHRQLEHAHLGVRLEAAERERDADLVVVARLGRDGAGVRAAEGGEDVLGRRLPHRARDRTNCAPLRSRTRPPIRARAACASSGTRVAAPPRSRRIREKRRAGAHGDEEVAGSDAAGVDLDAGDLVRGGLELAEPSRARRPERDHAAAPSRRSASRATVAVVERDLAVGELLALLVALAGDQDDVASARRARSRASIAAARSGSTSAPGARRRGSPR